MFFYNLGRNGKMPGSAQEIRYINRDENTHLWLFRNIILEMKLPVMPALMRISVYEPEFRQYLIYSAEDFGFGVHRVVVVDHAAVLNKTNIENEPRIMIEIGRASCRERV